MAQVINWIVTSGKIKIKDNTFKYIPEKFTNQLGKEEILTAVIRSNVVFDNGEISFKVRCKGQQGRCQVVLNYDEPPMVLAGLNVLHGLFGIARLNKTSNDFEALSVTGLSETFQINTDYEIRLRVSGSIIDLFINDVLVASAFEQIYPCQASLFFSSNDEIEVRDIKIDAKKSKAFVVMQFTEEYNDLYKEVIKPVTEEYGFECERADETHTTNPILQDIIQSIKESSVIIADITPNNPNVFYEVGYAHATNKPTILLCDRKREKLPFDISGFRTLFYDNTIAGKSAVEKSLKKYLEGITTM